MKKEIFLRFLLNNGASEVMVTRDSEVKSCMIEKLNIGNCNIISKVCLIEGRLLAFPCSVRSQEFVHL